MPPAATTAPPAEGIQYRTVDFRAGGSEGLGDNEFDGHAAVFNSLDSYFTVFAPGCFARTLPRFRERGVVAWQHDWTQPIGKPVDAHEDATGLYIRGKISDVPAGRDALTLMRDGVITSLSFGFKVQRQRDMTEEEGIAMFGEMEYLRALASLPWWADGIEVIEDVDLYEVSPVTVASNPNATITGVRDGSLAGLTLTDHSDTALAVVREWTGRMQAIADLKVREGRVLSEANRTKLVSMRDSLGDHCTMLDDLLAATAPKDDEGDRAAEEAAERQAEARKLYAHYLRSEAVARGVALS